MALQNDNMLEQVEEMRKMIASGRVLSQQIEQKSDALIEAVAIAKTNMKDAGFKSLKNVNAKDTFNTISSINTKNEMQMNRRPDIAGLPLIEKQKAGKRKTVL